MQLSSLSSLEWNLIAGGLAIFLFGISLMGDALTNFAGPKLRGYVENTPQIQSRVSLSESL